MPRKQSKNVRIRDELHRAYKAEAAKKGIALEVLVNNILSKALGATHG